MEAPLADFSQVDNLDDEIDSETSVKGNGDNTIKNDDCQVASIEGLKLKEKQDKELQLAKFRQAMQPKRSHLGRLSIPKEEILSFSIYDNIVVANLDPLILQNKGKRGYIFKKFEFKRLYNIINKINNNI